MLSGKYPVVTGLEHDEWGHPSGNPKMHQNMTNRRRDKIKALMSEIPAPDYFGVENAEVLLVGWGSTYGPIRTAVQSGMESGRSIACIHLRHIHPLPNGLVELFARHKHIIVTEMNDEGLYGYGQLATLLRARYCDPRIQGLCKTDGLTFTIKEILAGIDRLTA